MAKCFQEHGVKTNGRSVTFVFGSRLYMRWVREAEINRVHDDVPFGATKCSPAASANALNAPAQELVPSACLTFCFKLKN